MQSEKYHNFVAFKNKCTRDKIANLLRIATESKVDIKEEATMLKEWLSTYDRIIEMWNEDTLFSENTHGKVK